MIRKLLKWINSLFIRAYTFEFMEDIPDILNSKVVYFIGHEGYYWQAAMICPCGCKKIIQLNLITDHKPYWKYKIERNKKITLVPSVHRMVGCKSHFFVRNGKIIWA
jgi:hypothetical protein